MGGRLPHLPPPPPFHWHVTWRCHQNVAARQLSASIPVRDGAIGSYWDCAELCGLRAAVQSERSRATGAIIREEWAACRAGGAAQVPPRRGGWVVVFSQSCCCTTSGCFAAVAACVAVVLDPGSELAAGLYTTWDRVCHCPDGLPDRPRQTPEPTPTGSEQGCFVQTEPLASTFCQKLPNLDPAYVK